MIPPKNHKELCTLLRELVKELFTLTRGGSSGLYHAIDAFEREPEYRKAIELAIKYIEGKGENVSEREKEPVLSQLKATLGGQFGPEKYMIQISAKNIPPTYLRKPGSDELEEFTSKEEAESVARGINEGIRTSLDVIVEVVRHE